MSYFTKKQIFHINSFNRIEGTLSDFSYKINLDTTLDFDRVVVLSCSIPKSFYLIQENQNTFVLEENSSQATVTLTPGNYTRASLAIELKSKMNASSPNGYTYNITYKNINSVPDDGKYIFTVSGNGSVQPKIITGDYLYGQIGFNKDSEYQFSSGTLTCPNVCNLSVETTLYLHSDICQNDEKNNVLQAIYSNGEASFSYVNFQNPIPSEYSRKITNNKSNVYRFSLRDENGTLIDTNGININFTIMVYKSEDINSLIKGAIKFFTLRE